MLNGVMLRVKTGRKGIGYAQKLSRKSRDESIIRAFILSTNDLFELFTIFSGPFYYFSRMMILVSVKLSH